MAQLNVRLTDSTREAVDALARARGVTASDLVRDLVHNAVGLTGADRRPGDEAPPHLSLTYRRTLALQHEILARLTVDPQEDDGWEAAYHRRMVTVLDAGYTSEYGDLFRMVQPEMTARECALVHDILEMFSTLEQSLDRMTPEQRATLGEDAGHALALRGFDFNDATESRMASYAQFVIADGRWKSMALKFDSAHQHGNSHSPVLASYERMLAVWRPLWKAKVAGHGGPRDYVFTVDEMRQIRAAWPFPNN